VSKVTLPVDRIYIYTVMYNLGGFLWSSVDTNSLSCSVSEILHLNPPTHFGQFRGPRPTLWRLEERAPEGILTPAEHMVTVAVGVYTENQLDRPSRLAIIHSRLRQTDRRPQKPHLRVGQKLSRSPAGGRVR